MDDASDTTAFVFGFMCLLLCSVVHHRRKAEDRSRLQGSSTRGVQFAGASDDADLSYASKSHSSTCQAAIASLGQVAQRIRFGLAFLLYTLAVVLFLIGPGEEGRAYDQAFICAFFATALASAWRSKARGVMRMAREEGRQLQEVPQGFFWGGREVARPDPNTLVIGCPGSGKSLLMKMSMASRLPDGNGGLVDRAFVFEPKRELVPVLTAMGVELSNIIVTLPTDARAWRWDVAADLAECPHEVLDALALQLAEVFAPKASGEKQPFFKEATQALLVQAFLALHATRPRAWTLNDLCETFATQESLRQLLARTLDGAAAWDSYLGETSSETASSVFATISNTMAFLRPVARMLDSATETFSLVEWHRSAAGEHKVLLLGGDPIVSKAVSIYNKMIFALVSQLVRARVEEDPRDLTYVFLDEMKIFAGDQALPGLDTFLTEARSKGGRTFVAVQDKPGAAVALGGASQADQILGLSAGNFAFLRVSCPVTAQWMSKRLGDEEAWVTSLTDGANGQQSTNHRVQQRPLVLPSDFMFRLHPASPAQGITGYFSAPGQGPWKETLSGASVRQLVPLPGPDAPPGFVPRGVPGGGASSELATPAVEVVPAGPRELRRIRRIS